MMPSAKSLVMKPLFKMRVEKDKTKYDRKKTLVQKEIKDEISD